MEKAYFLGIGVQENGDRSPVELQEVVYLYFPREGLPNKCRVRVLENRRRGLYVVEPATLTGPEGYTAHVLGTQQLARVATIGVDTSEVVSLDYHVLTLHNTGSSPLFIPRQGRPASMLLMQARKEVWTPRQASNEFRFQTTGHRSLVCHVREYELQPGETLPANKTITLQYNK